MSVISLKKANCKNCYKCVRVCPVKSILIKDQQAEIIPHDCILCGRCLEACPQNAKVITSDVDKVKGFMASDKRVIVSLAPAFLGSFHFEKPAQVVGALLALGFDEVSETAQGAVAVTNEYYEQIQEGRMKNIITTCCPTINDMVEKYYPDLVEYLSPTVSPMIAHGKMLKERYGHETKVVFIGPCISKKREAEDIRHDSAIDAVLTFEEVNQWLKEEHIEVSAQPEKPFNGLNPKVARLYPVSAGVIKSLEKKGGLRNYNMISVDGIERCMDMLSAMQENQVENCFVEMTACSGSCVNGPAKASKENGWFKAHIDIENYTNEDNDVYPELETSVSFRKKFIDNSAKPELPDEETIRSILRKIGKETPDQELNCGFCGYPSCREKAIAVYQNKAQLYMCLPYMSEMSQSMSNVILGKTPNIIIAVDSEMKILEFNAAAEEVFGVSRSNALKKYLYEFIDTSDFEFVVQSHDSISDKKVSYPEYHIITEQTITFVPGQDIVIGVFKDITTEQEQEEKMYQLKVDTIDMAQKVIDKQMVVAQEIASLLGETTAETKVTLTKLKDMIIYNGEKK